MVGFDGDPFEDIVREFFGGQSPNARRRINVASEGQGQNYSANFNAVVSEVAHGNNYYYIILIPEKVTKEQIHLEREGSTLKIKILSSDSEIHLSLPKSLQTKSYSYELNNGILEIAFKK